MSQLALILQKYKNDNIALYGLSNETERVIPELNNQYNIVGLLDSFCRDGEIYGKPIISMDEAVKRKVKLIVVVARPGSCKAIARKIEGFCKDNNIALYDIRGVDLTVRNRIQYSFNNVDGITKDEFYKFVDDSEIISIDLFDTLIMRRTLLSTDVIDIAYARLKEKGIYIEDFFDRRLESEKHLSKNTAPTLIEIYSYMIKKYSISGITAKMLADNEWKVDYELVIPRKELCDIVSDYFDKGRKVYIVSDTYYSRMQLEKMLEKCNIQFYTDILASCEYKTGKTQSLFNVLNNKINGEKCIHIGDDEVADIKSSEKAGIKSCRIYSGIDLFENVGYLGLWDFVKTLSDRIKLGMLVSCLFNSPFQFESEGMNIEVGNSYEIGYNIFAPVISDFVVWLKNQIRINSMRNIWFCARDGYLIKKMYDEFDLKQNSIYFLTSRMAAIRAGIQDVQDIEYVEQMHFSGSVKEQLKCRLGIETDIEKEKLIDFSEEILEHAAECRENYRKYIAGLNMDVGDIAFFDFVAKGTCQMFISNIVNEHLKGFYFLRLDEEEMKDKNLDIMTFYEKGDKKDSAIFNDYYILETILTSSMPSVTEFDSLGQPLYAHETRTDKAIHCFEKVQEGIFDYFKFYISICPEKELIENKKLDEEILSLIHKIKVKEEEFLEFKVEDVFFNRMTDMSSLV
jgi:hypothetical protein